VGLAFACFWLFVLIVTHSFYLIRLERWLIDPESTIIPEATGAWGNVFVRLYRMLKRADKARDKVLVELELFRQACSALPDGVVFLDAQGHIVWCNGMAEKHLGINSTRDAGLTFTHFVRQPGFASFFSNSQSGTTFTYNSLHAAGQTLSLEVIPFEENRKLLISFDITQIERVETMRRDFVANVSHELRTPLTVIGGFLEHLTGDEIIEKRTARRQFVLMENQTKRMLSLVDDLLTLSRLEVADKLPREEEVNVREVLEAVLEEARGLSAGRHVLTLEACPTWLAGGREELRSVFTNFVSNAVRYTPEGGQITLRWAVVNDKGVFSVEDTGIGIAEELIPRLTERFYRVDRGRSQETGGTGLGLAIVKHVLLRHQATLDVQSQPGKGSVFSAIFPAWRLIKTSSLILANPTHHSQ